MSKLTDYEITAFVAFVMSTLTPSGPRASSRHALGEVPVLAATPFGNAPAHAEVYGRDDAAANDFAAHLWKLFHEAKAGLHGPSIPKACASEPRGGASSGPRQ